MVFLRLIEAPGRRGNVINLSFFYNFMNFDGFGDLTFLSVSEKVSESIHRYYCYIKKDT